MAQMSRGSASSRRATRVSGTDLGLRVLMRDGYLVPPDFDYVVNNNDALNDTWSRFQTPIVQHTTIDSDGYGEGNLPPAVPSQPFFFFLNLGSSPPLRVERNRTPPAAHGRFWTDQVPRPLPRVR